MFVKINFIHQLRASSDFKEVILADLEFKLLDSLGQSEGFFFKRCFLSLEVTNRLIKSLGFSLLVCIMSGNFLNNAM